VSVPRPAIVDTARSCGTTVVTVLSATRAPFASVSAMRSLITPGPVAFASLNFSPSFSLIDLYSMSVSIF
jgi:hypothetical protein